MGDVPTKAQVVFDQNTTCNGIHTQPFIHVFFEWEGFSLKRNRRVHGPGVISSSAPGPGQSRLWLALVMSHGQPSGRVDCQIYMSILLFVDCLLLLDT